MKFKRFNYLKCINYDNFLNIIQSNCEDVLPNARKFGLGGTLTNTLTLTILEKGKDFAALNYFEPTGKKLIIY